MKASVFALLLTIAGSGSVQAQEACERVDSLRVSLATEIKVIESGVTTSGPVGIDDFDNCVAQSDALAREIRASLGSQKPDEEMTHVLYALEVEQRQVCGCGAIATRQGFLDRISKVTQESICEPILSAMRKAERNWNMHECTNRLFEERAAWRRAQQGNAGPGGEENDNR